MLALPALARLLGVPQGCRTEVTLELGDILPRPFPWILFKYWLNKLLSGVLVCQERAFYCFILVFVFFFPFYPQDPLARGRAVYT